MYSITLLDGGDFEVRKVEAPAEARVERDALREACARIEARRTSIADSRAKTKRTQSIMTGAEYLAMAQMHVDKSNDSIREIWPIAKAMGNPLSEAPTHDSDCALHNAPALPVGPCNCSAGKKRAPLAYFTEQQERAIFDRFADFEVSRGGEDSEHAIPFGRVCLDGPGAFKAPQQKL
jgi:hypothetical protein